MTTKKPDDLETQEEEAHAPEEQTMESLLREQSEFQDKLQKRDVVWVKVIQVDKERVLVDIGEKSEGAVPLAEFTDEPPTAGKRIPVILVKKGHGDQHTLMSTAKAQWRLGWEGICKAFEEKSRVKGKVTSSIKGGFLVNVNGVTGFMPASLADLRPVRTPDQMVGTGVRCYIIELNKEKEQIILSRRAVLEEDLKKRKEKLLGELKVGDVRIGRIMRVADPGVFVDIGGLEGLLRTEDVAWKDAEAAKAKLVRGHKLRVRVLQIEGAEQKVSLGLKQLQPHPSEAIRRKYPVKAVVKGEVSEVLKEGVRIKLVKGDTAFCAVPELQTEGADPLARDDSWRDDRQRATGPGHRETPPPIWPKVGDPVTAIVLGVHNPTFEVSVSIRRYENMQDRKHVAQYMKEAPRPTLGQLLNPDGE